MPDLSCKDATATRVCYRGFSSRYVMPFKRQAAYKYSTGVSGNQSAPLRRPISALTDIKEDLEITLCKDVLKRHRGTLIF